MKIDPSSGINPDLSRSLSVSQEHCVKYRFSILMPVYNRENYVGEAIDSVLAQTFKDFELFAIDDGSSDLTAAVLVSYGTRIKLLQQPNQGPEVARNKAAALAQGEYLVFLDSDDFFFPFALETFDQVIRNFDSPPLVLGSLAFFHEAAGKEPEIPAAHPVKVFKYQDYLSKTRPLGTNCIVVRKSVFDEVGGMRNSTPQTFYGDDTNLLLKVGTYGPCVVIDQPCTSAYRQHGKNSSRDVKAIADAILQLANTERRGGFSGGKARRWDRYSYIGGRAASWAINYCWRHGQRTLALKLLAGTASMVMAAAGGKFLRLFRHSEPEIIL
jgi:glycosyltransferase involved in cell wall biosynthesis